MKGLADRFNKICGNVVKVTMLLVGVLYTMQNGECYSGTVGIELDLNRGVNLFWSIREQDTIIGGCYLAFSPLLLYRGEG